MQTGGFYKKKAVVIIICAAVVIALGVAGLIIFMPKNESIHFDREFIKRENGLVKEEGNTLTEHRRIFRWMSV
ncbi:MAG: hypothetical protein ACLS48_01675 [[Eubacterium] siraeum]